MPGTKQGGAKVRARLLAKDPEYYQKLGAKGGKALHNKPRGFAAMTPEKHKQVSKMGGKNSSRKH